MKKQFNILLSLLLILVMGSCSKEDNSAPPVKVNNDNLKVSSINNLVPIDPFTSVTIGSQSWMKFNLNVDHYRNGDPIPQATDYYTWAHTPEGAWCYYNNDPANGVKYGKLYNYLAVSDARGLAPSGYHVPTDMEWTTLTTYLGGTAVAGGKLKTVGTVNWQSPNTGATNSSGFSALPGGRRTYAGTFASVSSFVFWWSATSNNGLDSAYLRNINYNNGIVITGLDNFHEGFSVRCVRD